MSEESPDKTKSVSQDLPKAGDEVAGMKIVDPVAATDGYRTTDLAAKNAADKKGAAKKPKATPAGPSIDTVSERIKKILPDESLTIEVISAEEHPRGPVISIKRLPDVTRPVAYLDSGDGTWSDESLSLNLYGFLDSSTMEALQGPLRDEFKLLDRDVSTFTRF